MATGIEAAGLVLGSIPLILAAMQFYAEGIAVTRRYRKYRAGIETLIVEITTENAKFRNSVELLLMGIVSPYDIAALLEKTGGALWREESLERNMKQRLGSSYNAYFSTIILLHQTTESLKKRLKLGPDGKVVRYTQ